MAVPADLPKVAELWGRLVQEERGKLSLDRKKDFVLHHLVSLPHENLFVYDVDQGIAGFVLFHGIRIPYGDPKDAVNIEHLYVAKKYRKNGVANKLVGMVHEVYPGRPVIAISANDKFWEKLGLTKVYSVYRGKLKETV